MKRKSRWIRRKTSDFVNKYYDINEDWGLIESSFAMQYGIRLSKEDITIPEFQTMLANIMPDTPLGQIAQIRSEKDPKIIKRFNKQQKHIRNQWSSRMAKKQEAAMSDEQKRKMTNEIKDIFFAAFGSEAKKA